MEKLWLSLNPVIREDGVFKKSGETTEQVTRVGCAADEQPVNTV